MSNVWETRYRLLLERLEELAGQLRSEEEIVPAALEEQTERLLTGVVMLLRKHHVNKWGQCKYCGWTRWTWRFCRRRPRCTVYRSLDFAMSQCMEIVRQQLLDY